MDISKITSGPNVPDDIHVVIEIPRGASPIKYEMDKESGFLRVDRWLQTPMYYPAHYGFIPNTLSEDGDPTDVLLCCDTHLIPGCIVYARPIGVLDLQDESGQDEKIIAVPHESLHAQFSRIQKVDDLFEFKAQIIHFFEHYKDLDSNKWVKVEGWGDVNQAKKLINEAIDRYK